jgi:hypothetical protein
MRPIELRLYTHLDLHKDGMKLPLSEITIGDVKLTMRDICEAHRCIVIDVTGAFKILKDRSPDYKGEYLVIVRPRSMQYNEIEDYIESMRHERFRDT